jgi:hypothetical protein
MIRRTAMRSARWQDPSVTPSVALAVAPGGAIRPIEDPASRRQPYLRLVGWIGGSDPLDQVRLEFPSKEAALAYAERYGLVCEVSEPHRRRIVPRSYAENFVVPPKRDARSKFLAAA